jgi:hypothetical protein
MINNLKAGVFLLLQLQDRNEIPPQLAKRLTIRDLNNIVSGNFINLIRMRNT